MKKWIMAALAASLVMPAPVLANDSELINPDPEEPVLVQSSERAAKVGDSENITALFVDFQENGKTIKEDLITFGHYYDHVDVSHFTEAIPRGYHFVKKPDFVILSDLPLIDYDGEQWRHLEVPIQKIDDEKTQNLDFDAEVPIVVFYQNPEDEYKVEQRTRIDGFFSYENRNMNLVLEAEELSELFRLCYTTHYLQ